MQAERAQDDEPDEGGADPWRIRRGGDDLLLGQAGGGAGQGTLPWRAGGHVEGLRGSWFGHVVLRDRFPGGSGAQGPYTESAEVCASIVDAALEVEVFAESGFRAGTVKGIAQRAGTSQRGLVHHFRTREDLLAEVLTARAAESATPMRDGPPREVLRGVVGIMVDNARRPRLVELHSALSAEGLAPGVTPALAAATLVAIQDGIQVRWLYEPDIVDMARTVTAYLTSIAPGLDLGSTTAPTHHRWVGGGRPGLVRSTKVWTDAIGPAYTQQLPFLRTFVLTDRVSLIAGDEDRHECADLSDLGDRPVDRRGPGRPVPPLRRAARPRAGGPPRRGRRLGDPALRPAAGGAG